MIQDSSEDDEFLIPDLEERAYDVRSQDFSELLQRIQRIDEKKKKLWLEIYQNALSDRHNAYVLFRDLTMICRSSLVKSTEYAAHSAAIAKFLDQMRRANEQIIKLAALITQAEKSSNLIDSEEMFNRIQSQ